MPRLGRDWVVVEKFFSKSYFLLVSGSIYDSEFQGLDGVWRNTDWNSNFALNVVGGIEKPLGKGSVGLSGKITWAGGKRYGNVDSLETVRQAEMQYLADGYNEFQFKDYFRTDLKLKYNLKERLYNTLFFIDIKSSKYSDIKRANLYVQKMISLFNLLRVKDAKLNAIAIGEKVIQTAMEYEFALEVIHLA